VPRLVVFGDHRRPLWFDRLRGAGEAGRRAVLRGIEAAGADLVLDTGDLVPSASAGSWRRVDRDVAALRARGTALEAVPGNHETYGWLPRSARPRARMRRFLERFPREGGTRWGARELGSTRLLLLDSNERVLDAGEVAAQEAFLEERVAAWDADPAAALVVAAWHHPPFTNGTKYADDRFAARSFLPRLRRSRKLAAVFCGHVHAYERFRADGATFVVTGGGGARRHRFPRDPARERHTPAFDARALPHLHYVVVDLEGAIGHARARHVDLSGPEPRWIDGDAFEIRPRG
jgi:3',5'-cyclic AMP phosphodiesterase CpdA